MDWEQANVGLDQEAFKAAQAAGESGFSIPAWIIVVMVIIGAIMALSVAKKSKDGGSESGGSDSGDKK